MPPLSTNDQEDNTMALQSCDQNSSGVEDHLSTMATLASLSHKITSYKAKLDEWAEKERRMADELVESYQTKLREEQSSIDTHVGDLLAVQLELGLNLQSGKENDQPTEAEEQQQRSIAARKLAMEKQHDDMTSEILKLQAEMNERGARIKEIEAEESKHLARAQEARDLKNRVKESKKATIDDLTRGLINYKQLGLEFQRAEEENNLRFVFTLLDKKAPKREFSFVLKVDDDDKYKIENCKPFVDAEIVQEVEQHLNATDDMANFALRMRQAFAETI